MLKYPEEQGENTKKIKALRLELKKLEGRQKDVDQFLETVRRYTDATKITQRPDTNVVPGQIKSNLDFQVCGRADSILSGIILGNGSADEQIPKDARGRFITGDGTVFQAYLFDEGRL